jgi:hypothetical protein
VRANPMFPSLVGRDKGRVIMECIHVDANGEYSCPIHWAFSSSINQATTWAELNSAPTRKQT